MNTNLMKMIETYQEDTDFFGSVSQTDIATAEAALGFTFPAEYREYVEKFGSGGICGIAIEGVERNRGASVVNATERWRRLGLEQNFVVIMDNGEFAMCMDAQGNDGKVYAQYRSKNNTQERYPSFTDFLTDYFQEGIDNL